LTRRWSEQQIPRSSALPGGTLTAALFDRRVMALADRGGASGMVGHRWADLCAEALAELVGQALPAANEADEPFILERVVRFDDEPRIATAASKKGLQNPDFILVVRRGEQTLLLGADAKFSIETARSKQVSADVVIALLELGKIVNQLIGDLPSETEVVSGLFLSPDYPLTELMLQGRYGIMKATVKASESLLFDAEPARFFAPAEGSGFMPALASIDRLDAQLDRSLMAGLYYFRLSRAAIGCWMETKRPLLGPQQQVPVELDEVAREIERRSAGARTALRMIEDWDIDTESFRSQRQSVNHVAGLPVQSKQMRAWIDQVVGTSGKTPPSINQVKRRLGGWYRDRLVDHFGPLNPPVEPFAETLAQIGRYAATLEPLLEQQALGIIRDLVEAPPAADPEEL
jgi:hypothetical protein